MSSDVVYVCSTCSRTVKGKQHYAICVSCSRRVHRMCYRDGLINVDWTMIRKAFTCTACEVGSRGQHFNGNSTAESIEKTHDVSLYVPPTTIEYAIIIGASQMGGELVTDSCGYTYGFFRDYPSLRVWRCAFRGCVKFPRCYSTLRQITRPWTDILRNYSQEDFTSDAEKAHSHPPNYGVEKRQLTVGQSCSTSKFTCVLPVPGQLRVNSIMLFVFRVRDECIVSVMVRFYVTITGQGFDRRLLVLHVKQEVGANTLTVTTLVMVHGSSLLKNQCEHPTMCQHTFQQQLLSTKL
jgi:DNA-directed RNA polymerase subunit RPC12/RpoP